MATGATNTLTQDLRIELKFMTEGFKKQANDAGNSLKKLDGKFKTTARGAERAQRASAGFAEGLKALITLQAGRSILNTTLSFDRVANRMKFATSSLDEFNESIELTRTTSNKLGLALIETQRGFATISASAKGTALQGESVKEIFNAVANASGALSLSADETNSVFLAFSQIISKGKVQAEELRGQIGERLPGAVNIASRALGVTNQELDKMLEKGEVLADDFLPKFARELNKTFGADALTNASSLTAQINKLNNTILTVVNTTGKWALENSLVFNGYQKIAELIEASALDDAQDVRALGFLPSEVDALTNKLDSGQITLGQYNDELRKLSGFYSQIRDEANLGEKDIEKFNEQIEKLTGFEARTDFSKRKFTTDSILGANRQRLKDQALLIEKALEREKELAIASQSLSKLVAKGFNAPSTIGKAIKSGFDFLNDPFGEATKLQDIVDTATATAQTERLKQGIAEKDRIKNLEKQEDILKTQLKTLKEQEKALQGGGQVNFVRSVQAGSEQANRRSIETRAKLAGGVRGNEELLRENNQAQERIIQVLENIDENLTVEKV